MRELDPRRDGDHFEGAGLAASVAGLGAAMGFGDLPPRRFGELAAPRGLVDREQPVHPTVMQGGDMVALGV